MSIFLKIFPSGQNRSLLGQLVYRSLKSRVPGPKVHLMGQTSQILGTTVDELGEFRFKHVPKGPVRLQVDIPPDLRVVGDFVVSLES